jgi:hypothetical protein
MHLFSAHNLEAADRLLAVVGKHRMQMVLPPGIPTLKALAMGNLTRVDNVFCDENSRGIFDYCDTRPADMPVKPDHFPIISHIHLSMAANIFTARYDFWDVEWESFNKRLSAELSVLPLSREILDKCAADVWLRDVNKAIWRTIAACVDKTKPCPYSKRWWTKDLTATRKVVKKLARAAWKVKRILGHPDHARYKAMRNVYAEQLRDTKAAHWAQWLAGLDEDSVWTANRMAMGPSSDGGAARVPTLQSRDAITKEITGTARDNDAKADMSRVLPPETGDIVCAS